MRRALIFVIGAGLVAAGLLVSRYTVFFEPAAYLFDRTVQKPRELVLGPDPAWPPKDAAARFHKGEGVCLRYAEAATLSTEAQDEAALDALQEAALLENLEEVKALLHRWSEEDERRRHGPQSDEELLLLLSVKPTLGDRLALAFHTRPLAALQRMQQERGRALLVEKAEAEAAKLASVNRDVLEAIWTQHRVALAPQGRIFTRAGWKARVTRVRLERIRAAIETFHAVYQKCPASLEDLDEKVAKTTLVDGFGRSFEYQKHATGCRVTSLGMDGYPGGLGPSGDLEMTVGLSPSK